MESPLPGGNGSVSISAGTIPRPRRVTNLSSASGFLACGPPCFPGTAETPGLPESFGFPPRAFPPARGGQWPKRGTSTAYSCGAAPDFNRIP